MQVRIKLPITFIGYGEGKTKKEAINSALDSIAFQNFFCLDGEDYDNITEVKECKWEWKDNGRYKGEIT